MRPQFLISLSLLVLAIIAIVFWLRPTRKPAELTPSIQAVVKPNSTIQVVSGRANQNASSQPQPDVTMQASPKVESDEEKTERLVREANEKGLQPIEFYGEVIDQDGNPLSNAKIQVSILQESTGMPTASGDLPTTNNLVHVEQETTADGRFEITGEKGHNINIESIVKDGYEVEPDNCPHSYGASGGSLQNPMIFKMWNTNIHEQLITGDKKFQIVPNGQPYFIDLMKGQISQTEGGDLKVWVNYPEQTVHTNFYDWSCEIDVINGGLCPGESYSMFTAPADGYVPTFSLQKKIRGGGSGSIGDRQFYVMLDNGRIFGRIQIDLVAPYNMGIPGMIRLSYAINPSGSRILR